LPGWQAHTTTPRFFSIERKSYKLFCLGWPGAEILTISASYIAWDNRCVPPPAMRLRMGSPCLGWLQIMILLISASQVLGLQAWVSGSWLSIV
jgi:hypothetical protein